MIGPNGAGKTTFVNLLTGILRPDRGRILLDGEDITARKPFERARRGIARTFQINQLFGDMTPLETVGLAVSERLGSGSDWWRLPGSRPQVTDEIVEILDRFRLAPVMHERTATLPYGRQRLLEIALACACKPRVLLLDEPAAGVPTSESAEIFDTLAALPSDVSVLLIEHDMDLVFRFASRISVLVDGTLFADGPADEIARDPRVKAAYLGEAVRMAELLRVRGLRAGYGESVVIDGIDLSLGEGQSLALLGRNGTGKTTLLATLVGVTRYRGGSIELDGRAIAPLRADQRAAAGLGWVPQERNIWKSLTVEENLTAVARTGPWTPARVFELFPRLGERRGNLGTQLSGGEQQMLAIGRALVLNPRLLLLDEPLEGLAPLIVEELLRVITSLVRDEGMSAIVVEQNPARVLSITDRAVILERGTVVHAGASADLANDEATLDRYLTVAARA